MAVVVDAGCLYDLVSESGVAALLRHRLAAEHDLLAPHVIDVEVFGVIRREFVRGRADGTASRLAVEKLASWPGRRYPHDIFLSRAWQLRDNVRGWDAMYVALAELLDATLLTTDRRLAAATGPRCPIEVL